MSRSEAHQYKDRDRFNQLMDDYDAANPFTVSEDMSSEEDEEGDCEEEDEDGGAQD